MPDWITNYAEFKKKGTLSTEDYAEMIRKWNVWATHLAISQSNPDTATREEIFTRAEELRHKMGP